MNFLMQLKAIRPFRFFALALSGILAISIGMTAQTPAKGPGGVHFTATMDNVGGAGDTVKINLLGWSTDADRDQLLAAWNLTPAPAAGARGGGGRGAGGAGGRGAGGAGRGARGAAAAADDAAGDDASPADALPAATGRGARGGGRGGRGGNTAPAPPETPESSLTAALQKTPTVGILWTTSEITGYSIHYAYRFPQPDGGERIVLATDRRLGVWNNLWKAAGSPTPNEYSFSVIELRLNAKGEGEGKASLTGKVTVDTAAKTIALDSYSALPIVLKGVKRQ
jgi:hypothetical protein